MRIGRVAGSILALGGFAIVVICGFAFIVIIALDSLTGGKPPELSATASPRSVQGVAQQPSAVADPLAEMHATERKNYVQGLNSVLDGGAFARDSDGELVIKSPELVDRVARDALMSTSFSPRRLEGLCNMGFKGIKLYASTFGDSTEYSVCQESKKDREERLHAQFAKRQEFARNLAAGLNSNSDVQSIDVIGSELVFTGKGLDPSFVQSNLPLMMDQNAKSNACGLGFTGMRVRPSPESKGTFISYRCPK